MSQLFPLYFTLVLILKVIIRKSSARVDSTRHCTISSTVIILCTWYSLSSKLQYMLDKNITSKNSSKTKMHDRFLWETSRSGCLHYECLDGKVRF